MSADRRRAMTRFIAVNFLDEEAAADAATSWLPSTAAEFEAIEADLVEELTGALEDRWREFKERKSKC